MNMINKEPERHEIEALLPWHAAGTLSRRDADRVEQALAGDRELAPALSTLFAKNWPRRSISTRRWVRRRRGPWRSCSQRSTPRRRRAPTPPAFVRLCRPAFRSSCRASRRARWPGRQPPPRLAIVVQAAVITGVVVKEQGTSTGPEPCAARPATASFAVVRFAPQATATDITNFLGAYKATVVEGPQYGWPALSHPSFRGQAAEGRGRQDHPADAGQNKVVGFIAVNE